MEIKFKKDFTFERDLLEVVENKSFSKNLPDLIYYERTGNMLGSQDIKGNIYGYLKNRTKYLRPEYVINYKDINIAVSIDHIKHLIYGTAAEWLFGKFHPELIKLGTELGSWHFERKAEDINKADFKDIAGNIIEFKAQSPEYITTELNGPKGKSFWTYYCHKAAVIYCWSCNREYRIAFNGLKWDFSETLVLPLNITTALTELSLKLNKINPNIVYDLNKEYFEGLPGLSKEEEEKINNYLELQGETDGKQTDLI